MAKFSWSTGDFEKDFIEFQTRGVCQIEPSPHPAVIGEYHVELKQNLISIIYCSFGQLGVNDNKGQFE